MIPTIATNVISNRFCREYGVQCNGQVWLNNQGQEQRNWPRFGVLTNVKVSSDEKLFGEIWSGLITKCSGMAFTLIFHILYVIYKNNQLLIMSSKQPILSPASFVQIYSESHMRDHKHIPERHAN